MTTTATNISAHTATNSHTTEYRRHHWLLTPPKFYANRRLSALRKMRPHDGKGVDIMRQLKMRETDDVIELTRKIDEDALSLAQLQGAGEREKKMKEELIYS